MRAVTWVLMLLPLILVVGAVLLMARGIRRSPARGSAGYDVAAGTGVWFARVRAPGRALGGWGQLRVYDGQVSFTLDGAGTPAWEVRADQLWVQRPSSMATTFHAELPQLGEVTIEPSTSKLARWRSAGSWAGSSYRTTQDVVTILQGWGARQSSSG